jgi:hypothetical protein
MMRNVRISTTRFDTHSPIFTPPTPTSNIPIVVSSAERNTSLFFKGDETYLLRLLTPPKTFGTPSSLTILPSYIKLNVDPYSLAYPLSMTFLGGPVFRLPLELLHAIYSQTVTLEVVLVMSNNKSEDKDGFQEYLFKNSLCALVSHLFDLLNYVVRTGFPMAWSHKIIHLIQKSDLGLDPNNYRMIVVGHTFSNIYAMVLHMKLSKDIDQRSMRARG